MRKLVVFGVVVAVILAVLALADVFVRHQVQSAIAQQIETQVPGSHAEVSISSFPFVGRLAVSGDVPKLTADVTNVAAGPITLDTVVVVVTDVHVARHQLVHGKVALRSIKQATVTATVSQASLDSQVGLPVTLGEGTVGLDGLQAAASLKVDGDQVDIQVPPLPAIAISIPVTKLLPCIGSASLTPGELTVTCTTNTLPPVLENLAPSF